MYLLQNINGFLTQFKLSENSGGFFGKVRQYINCSSIKASFDDYHKRLDAAESSLGLAVSFDIHRRQLAISKDVEVHQAVLVSLLSEVVLNQSLQIKAQETGFADIKQMFSSLQHEQEKNIDVTTSHSAANATKTHNLLPKWSLIASDIKYTEVQAIRGVEFPMVAWEGAFSNVYKAVWRGEKVAIKEVKKSFLKKSMQKATLQAFTQEADVIFGLSHPNIVGHLRRLTKVWRFILFLYLNCCLVHLPKH